MKAATRERHRALALLPEVRHFKATGLEVRSSATTDTIIIRGEPIVYGRWYTVIDALGEFEESMAPGVATETLARRPDVRFLFNHDGLPLARSTSGTMTILDTPTSLTFEARLDARQQLANDLAIAVERGDVSQMSCSFSVARDSWEKGNPERRTITLFRDLLDVSAVTYPASPTTSIAVAQRMALAVPVESRARVRRALANVAAGKQLTRNELTVLRSLVADQGAGDDTRPSRVSKDPIDAARTRLDERKSERQRLLRARLKAQAGSGALSREIQAEIKRRAA